MKEKQGAIAAYSDDHMRGGTREFRNILKPFDALFATHKTDKHTLQFAGFQINQGQDAILISQLSYVSAIQHINTKTRLDDARKSQTKKIAHQLLWHAKSIRPDLIYDASKVAHVINHRVDEAEVVKQLRSIAKQHECSEWVEVAPRVLEIRRITYC